MTKRVMPNSAGDKEVGAVFLGGTCWMLLSQIFANDSAFEAAVAQDLGG